MAKFFGGVGYATTEETTPGVWEDKPTVRNYYGDVMSNYRRLESSGDLNDNININVKISIVADPYAIQHFHAIRYVEFEGAKWKVTNVEPQHPRLILTLGGLYNG